ncbi:hypothetical protein AGLY_010867 [Aphis glycines]|uniref:protein-tyrosine-phosphatase n=1 Tax=Aphis glycines TaxID=307491 RepID=A0A6G0TFP1_APHGL|nr:hypothetical protein AGLY_010867 [Aphis glycines]
MPQGYTKPREYIVTEWPIKHTPGDFWSLVYDYECSAVVVLCLPPRDSQQYPPFWPEGRHSKKYGPVFTIDHISHNHYANIKTWLFRINKKIVSLTELMAGVKAPPRTVQLFQLTCWPLGHRVPTSTNSLVELMNMVERWRQRIDYGPVVVVSHDGRGRCGVYCAANACIEQVIQHGEVDVFQAVKTVRRHRPQLIENMVEAQWYCQFGRGAAQPLTPDQPGDDAAASRGDGWGASASGDGHGAAPAPIPYPGRYVVVKQFVVDRPETHPLPDTAPLHYYNPYYLRLDLKTHSTRLLHSSIQQTSVDATPEHHAAVVSGLTAAGVLLPESEPVASAPVPPLSSQRSDHRSCSIVSAGKKTVAFSDKVDVCDGGGDDDDDDGDDDDGDFDRRRPATVTAKTVAEVRTRAPAAAAAAPVVRCRAANVLQVHSQTGEIVGDVLIERKRDPPSPPSTATNTATPSPVDDDPTYTSGSSRRKRHEMFCRRRQSPVYSCDDGTGETAAANSPSSSSSSSVYESCDDDLNAVVVLGAELGRPPLRRSAAAVNGYVGCCPS